MMLTKTIFIKNYFTFLVLFFSVFAFAQKKFTIVLDAGHGGHDYGAKRSYDDLGDVIEKDIVLDIATRVGRMLEKNKDFKVIYTRKTDVFLSLTERTNLANRSKADLFVSIHVNANQRSSPYGTETFILGVAQNDTNLEVAKAENEVIFIDEQDRQNFASYDPRTPESLIALKIQQSRYREGSLLLAGFIESNFENKNNRFSRGVKQANFHVLRMNAMPSVLVEMGFLSNYEEARYLMSEKGRKEITESIYNGIISYKEAYDRKGGMVTLEAKPELPKEQPLKNDFRILLMSAPVKYNTTDPALKGLKYILTIKEGNLYKYYYANTNLASVRDNNLKTAKDAGFRNAIAIGFSPNQKMGNGYYTLEVYTSKDKLDRKSHILTTLKDDVVRNKENGIFYYTYGNVKSLEEAIELMKDLERKGISNIVIQKVSK